MPRLDAKKVAVFTAAIEKEIGAVPKVVDYRRDPKVPTTYAVQTEEDGCFLVGLVDINDPHLEVIDTFELEEGQTLRTLEVGEPRFL